MSLAPQSNWQNDAGLRQQPDLLYRAGEYQRRRNTTARIKRGQWVNTGCDKFMLFEDFRNPQVRNKILASYGRSPIFLPSEKNNSARQG